MGLTEQITGEKIHTRNISLATYPAEHNNIIVEGILKDDRPVGIYIATGEKKPPGTVHHMVIRMLIGQPGLTIRDIEVEMLQHPRPECIETMKSLDTLKDLQIKSGFTSKVKELIGGNKGCAHLTTLVNSMAQEVVQGFYTFIAQNSSDISKKDRKKGFSSYIADTCHVWRKEGPVMKKLLSEFNNS